MFRAADSSVLPGISRLWQEAFGDSPDCVSEFFAAFPGCRSYVAEEAGEIAAMVHALPQILRADADLPAAYIYAVATLKSHRGRGLCRNLMAFAEADLKQSGFRCAVLTPGEPGLFRFYEALGYEAVFTRNRAAWDGGGTPVSPLEYAQLREAWLPGPHMVYDAATLAYAQRVYALEFYKTPTGCCAAGPDYTAEVLPEDLGGRPFAMIKWLGPAQQIENAYLGFALE